MSARIIDGKSIAAALRARIGAEVARLPAPPGLAVVLVGEDPASAVYVRNKGTATREAGMRSIEHRLPADASQAALLALLARALGLPRRALALEAGATQRTKRIRIAADARAVAARLDAILGGRG